MKGANRMPISEKEIKKIELGTIYEVRLTISDKGDAMYSTEEILKILDDIAKIKNTPV